MYLRGRKYTRHQRYRAIQRKKNIAANIYGVDWCNSDGKYSKGKIYCSCPMCNGRYKRKNKSGWYIAPIREQRENVDAIQQLKEIYEEEVI